MHARSSRPGMSMISGESRTGVISRYKKQQDRQPLTSWRAEDRRRQQPSNAESHGSHSLPGEPRTGVVSSLQTQRATAATHSLESQGHASSAALKPSEPRQPLTNWRVEHQHGQVSLSEKRE